jgi:hypothetical protein
LLHAVHKLSHSLVRLLRLSLRTTSRDA